MDKELFITAEEVAKELRVSKSYAYKVIRQMNQQLKQNGFIVM
jgi:predicted transcriptional regulator